MKRLKIRLPFNYFLLIFILVYVIYFCFFYKADSKINQNNTTFCGRIINYKLKDDSIKIEIKGFEKVLGTYYYKSKNEIKDIKYGNYICFKGSIKEPNNNTVFNNFNYKDYLYHQKIYRIYNIDYFKIKHNKSILYSIKNYVYKRIDKLNSSKYITAILLGNKDYLDEEEYNLLKDNGILHLFCVSGMHVGFLIEIIKKFFKKEKWYVRDLIIILVTLLYSFIIGFLVSILRVLFCLIIKYIFKLLDIKTNNTNILLISAYILLLLNPFYIYNLGFLYSYALIFFIYQSKIKSSLKLCFLTFLVSAPITIYNFYQLNIISIFINIIFIPLVTCFIFPLAVLTFFFPFFDCFLEPVFKLFFIINRFLNNFKSFSFVVAKPPLVIVFLFYIFLMVAIKNKKYSFLVIISLVLICYKYFNNNNRVIFVDVKQGDSAVITTPHIQKTIMIDTGGIVSFNNKKYKISNNTITYLKSIGVSKISYLITTHGDFDHMGEAINLVENFKVEKVIFNCGEFNDLEKDLIKVLDKNKIPYYSCIKKLNINDNKLYFLQTKEYDNENDNSNVIYTEIDGYKFMFMGDAGVDKEKDLLKKYNISNIDVLKVGHHGSKTSSSRDFINEMSPKYSIISVGKNNRYGHPNKEVLGNLKYSKIYRTDKDGSIMFKIKNNKLNIETCSS